MKLIFFCFFIFFLSFHLSAKDFALFNVKNKLSQQIIVSNHGLGSLELRLQMIERAKKSIDLEYFIYRLDTSGKIFTQALIKKARQGVKVRMLLDYFMIKSQFSPFYAHEMKKYGIEVKYYNPSANLELFSVQYRNHRKVLLIDGKEALTGGRNIGDEYFDLSTEFNFLDRDIFVSGPIVTSIQKTFDQVFENQLAVDLERDPLPVKENYVDNSLSGGIDQFKYENDLNQFLNTESAAVSFFNDSIEDEKRLLEIRKKGAEELNNEYHGTCDEMTFHSEYPMIGRKSRGQRIIKHEIFKRMNNALESIVFDSPYFVVNQESSEALQNALNKKVKVKLLTNSLNSTDAVYTFTVFDTIIKKWINLGLETYIFKGMIPPLYQTMDDNIKSARFGIHAKTYIFDMKDVMIGTYNFDPRSANYNTEMNIICDNNPKLAEAVMADIELRMKGSFYLDSEEAIDKYRFYEVGFFKRLQYLFLAIPSNLFDYLL